MLLTLHNLPPRMRYPEIKTLIQSKCGSMQVILDNLVQNNHYKTVTVGLADDGDAAIFVRKMNGLLIDGCQLYVEDSRQKKGIEQPYRPMHYGGGALEVPGMLSSNVQNSGIPQPLMTMDTSIGGAEYGMYNMNMQNTAMDYQQQFMSVLPTGQFPMGVQSTYGNNAAQGSFVDNASYSDNRDQSNDRTSHESRKNQDLGWKDSRKRSRQDTYLTNRDRSRSRSRSPNKRNRGQQYDHRSQDNIQNPLENISYPAHLYARRDFLSISKPNSFPDVVSNPHGSPYYTQNLQTEGSLNQMIDPSNIRRETARDRPGFGQEPPLGFDLEPKGRSRFDEEQSKRSRYDQNPYRRPGFDRESPQRSGSAREHSRERSSPRRERVRTRARNRLGQEPNNQNPSYIRSGGNARPGFDRDSNYSDNRGQIPQLGQDRYFDQSASSSHRDKPLSSQGSEANWKKTAPLSNRNESGSFSAHSQRNENTIGPMLKKSRPNFGEDFIPIGGGPAKYPPPTVSAPRPPAPKSSNPAPRGPNPAPKGPNPSLRGPNPASRGPNPSIRGPNPAPRGHNPAPRGPNPSLRGPNPAPRGPNPALRGPNPGPRGPNPSIRGPNPAPRGLNPAPRGPNPSLRGPNPAPRGPNPAQKGPNPAPKGPNPVQVLQNQPRDNNFSEPRPNPTEKNNSQPNDNTEDIPPALKQAIKVHNNTLFQIGAQIARDIMREMQLEKKEKNGMLKPLKKAIRARFDLLLGDELCNSALKVEEMYRSKYPVSQDHIFFDEVLQILEKNRQNQASEGVGNPALKPTTPPKKANAPTTSAPPKNTIPPELIAQRLKIQENLAKLAVKDGKIPKFPGADKKNMKEQKQLGKAEYLNENLYELPELTKNALEQELDELCNIFTDACTNVDNQMEKTVIEKVIATSLPEFRRVMKLNATKRILNINANLSVRIFFYGKQPTTADLHDFLLDYGVVSCRKSVKAPNFLASVDTFDNYDRLLAMGNTKLGDTTISIKPLQITGYKTRPNSRKDKKAAPLPAQSIKILINKNPTNVKKSKTPKKQSIMKQESSNDQVKKETSHEPIDVKQETSFCADINIDNFAEEDLEDY